LLIGNGFSPSPLCRAGTPVARAPVDASRRQEVREKGAIHTGHATCSGGAAEDHMKHVLFGSLGVLTLGSMALAQSPPPGGVAESRTFERPFAEGGRVHLQLASGDYDVRAGASDRIVVRWDVDDDARIRDVRELFVDVRVTGSMAVIVTEGKTRRVNFVIELPARSDLSLRMRAGDIRLQGIDGHKEIRMTAGDLKIGVRRESLASAHASVTFGDLDARALGISKSGIKRTIDWFGGGEYELDARLGAGDLSVVENR
jgi:hypothetical protein